MMGAALGFPFSCPAKILPCAHSGNQQRARGPLMTAPSGLRFFAVKDGEIGLMHKQPQVKLPASPPLEGPPLRYSWPKQFV